MCVCAQSLSLCLTLCNPLVCSLSGPLSMKFSRQECWSGLPFATPGDLPDPGIEPVSLMPPALAGRFFITSATWNSSESKTVKIPSVTGSREVKMIKKIFEKVNRT